MRNREWRRHQNEAKFNRVRRHIARQYLYSARFYSYHSWLNAHDYLKRNSINEVITVTVRTEQQFEEYISHSARIVRDNPKNCGCDNCKGMRHKGYGNSSKILTIRERMNFMNMIEDVRDADIRTPNFKWRGRGRRGQLPR